MIVPCSLIVHHRVHTSSAEFMSHSSFYRLYKKNPGNYVWREKIVRRDGRAVNYIVLGHWFTSYYS